MSVITVGDVYQADAIDRRGYRVRFIVDGDSGAVLDRFVVGRSAYEAPVPIPPGLVPSDPGIRLAPSAPLPRSLGTETPRAPARSKQVRTPEPGASSDEPGKVGRDSPVEPAPSLRTTPAPTRNESAPSSAERPGSPVRDSRDPRSPVAAPSSTEPAPKSSPPREAASTGPTTPAPRTPEPLIDPKTGRSTSSVPVTPLDDARPASGARKPIAIVPPAPLE